MGAQRLYPALIQHHDLIGFHHAADALGNDDLGHIAPLFLQRLADQRVRSRVHGAGGVVQYQHLGLFQQSPGDAEALLLAAGHVGAALLDVGLVLIREALNKAVRLRQLAGMADLLVGGVFIAPAQILRNGAGEKLVLLQDEGHGVAQGCPDRNGARPRRRPPRCPR